MAEEKKLENYFAKTMEKAGWKALKLSCPGYDGMPDRMVLKDNGELFFAEIKAPGEQLRSLQKARHAQLRKRGFRVYTIDSKEVVYKVWGLEVNRNQKPETSGEAE